MIGGLALLLGLWSGSAQAEAPDNWKFSLDGYYRTRGYVFAGLYEGQTKPGTFMTHRLRLQPQLNFEDRAKFFMTVDALDGAFWGDNASLASTSLFAGDPSATGYDGGEITPIQLKRVWMEFKIPVGVLRVGRQGSNWGMGALANEGNGFDDTFGENRYGSTYDRAIFATKPVTIAQTIMGKTGAPEVPIIAAVGVDRLVEDPLIQYYGYECSDSDAEDGCTDPNEDHGYSEERSADNRQNTWWVDPNDDVWEMVYVLMYKGEGVKLSKTLTGDITAGLYGVNRRQKETESNILIVDGYVKSEIANTYFEGEIYHIGGTSRAITLAGAYDPTDTADPLLKDVDIWGYVARAGYQNETLTAYFEHGYASGDDKAADADFTGRAMNPDYNVGLILYEEVLARVTQETWSEEARGLWSSGGVYNSRYIYPTVKFRPLPNWEIVGAYLVAWPDKPDGSRIFCSEDDGIECAQYKATKDILGWEVDLAVKHKFHDHVNLSVEAGYAHATDRLPLQTTGLGYETDDDGHIYGNYFTFQTRVAYEF